MALECDWALLCERAFLDPPVDSQRPMGLESLCIVHVIEAALIDSLPAALRPMTLIAHISGFSDGTALGLHAIRPDGSNALQASNSYSRFVNPYLLWSLTHLIAPLEGVYRFEILFGDEERVARTVMLPVLLRVRGRTVTH
jgi:hypothetical protein